MSQPHIDFKRLQFKGVEGQLIPLLQQAQVRDNYISKETIREIHQKTGISISQIFGVATFYAQFRLSPVGKNIIRVCHGTACHVNSANAITQEIMDILHIKNGETTEDRLFTLETVSCLGCCSLAPVIMINDATYGNLTKKEVKKIIKQYLEKEGKEL